MSRDLSELHPHVRDLCRAHVAACLLEGIDLLVTQTWRSPEEQDRLYASGRTAPGHIVTNARAGDSMHQWRLAYDVVPLRDGRPVWRTAGADGALWARVGTLGEQLGLEWAGRWTGPLREMAHFQFTGGISIAELKAGKALVV